MDTNHVEMALFLENRFGVSIRPEALYEFGSLKEVASSVLEAAA